MDTLARQLLTQPVPAAARLLLGWYLTSELDGGRCSGRIVECEAYAGAEDRASHARAGPTRRTAPMFSTPGKAYVYLVYGLHECLNVVAHPDGAAGAVLLRALEPVEGTALMRRRRGRPSDPDIRLAAGPARLSQALGVSRGLSGHDLLSGERLWLRPPDVGQAPPDAEVASGPRIGVAYAGEPWTTLPWRFWLRGHPAVSR